MATDPGTATTAGGSARAEHARRLARHKERVRQRRPTLLALGAIALVVAAWAFTVGESPTIGIVAILVALSGLGRLVTIPTHVKAWAIGAEGEGRTAAALEPLAAEGFRILHDLPIPGSRANIDHVVIGPSGVFVIETKSFGGKLQIRGGDVYVAGRRKTAMLDEVRREVAVVASILADDLERLGIEVTPLICVHRAELPFFRSKAQDIAILSPKAVVNRLRKAEALMSPSDIERLAARLTPSSQRRPGSVESPSGSKMTAAPK